MDVNMAEITKLRKMSGAGMMDCTLGDIAGLAELKAAMEANK